MVKTTTNGDVVLAYETFGTGGRPILLLTGAAAQMVMWPTAFCEALAAKGFHVARMDNRGTGRSHDPTTAQFTLDDIAGDIAAVCDALGWPKAYLFGMSEGGIFAQATAVRRPDRVLGLISMASTPVLRPWISGPNLRAAWRVYRVMKRGATNRDELGQLWADVFAIAGSPPVDEQLWREVGRQHFDHGLRPEGDKRLFKAVLKAGDRRGELRTVTAPTLVLHGEADPLTLPKAGRETARAIPGAKLVTFPGMGHDLPPQLWTRIIEEVETFVRDVAAVTGRDRPIT
ncbi:alpha/beta fold hydrolase [Kutzneria sp. NPDC052558]|uniref:alpha/beta fold hydrolase n=1 Tax=Kutzneria sp. NPDC052558 TaxID=3364121 RepID=UPI0037C8B180